MIVTKTTTLRLIAYVITIICAMWTIGFVAYYGTSSGKSWYKHLAADYLNVSDVKPATPILHLTIPLLVSATISTFLLLVTSSHIPDAYRCLRCRSRFLPPSSSSSFLRRLFFCRPRRHNHRSGRCWDGDRCCLCCNSDDLSTTIDSESLSYHVLSFVVVLLPCLSYATGSLIRHLSSINEMSWDETLMEVGNVFGFVGMLALSWFLVPVTSHGVLLMVLGWSEVRAVTIHIWCGRIAVISSSIHGLFHLTRYLIAGNNILKMIIPPPSCYSSTTLSTTPPAVASWCHGSSCHCSDLFKNMTGVGSTICFVIVLLTSLSSIRRLYHNLFIKTHHIVGPLALLLLFCHYEKAVLYLSPSLLYYIASTCPLLVSSWRQRWVNGGVRVISAKCLEQSGGCVELNLDVGCQYYRYCYSSNRVVAEQQQASLLNNRACLFVKLCIPSLSRVWHPFTVIPPVVVGNDNNNSSSSNENNVGGGGNMMRIIMRATGPFTRSVDGMIARQQHQQHSNNHNAPLPLPSSSIVLVDGFYGRDPDRLHQALRHDAVVMIAGGIGVTPYLSLCLLLLKSLLATTTQTSSLSMGNNGSVETSSTNVVVLHWACRDEGLIDHVEKTFFWQLQRLCYHATDDAVFQFKVVIYHTADDTTEQSSSSLAASNNVDHFTIGDDDDDYEEQNDNEQTEPSTTNQHDENDNEQELEDTYNDDHFSMRGVGMTPPRFIAGQGRSLKDNLPPTILFAGMSFGGLYILYDGYEMAHDTNLIYDRLYGLGLVVILAFIVSIVADVIMECSSSLLSRYYFEEVSSSPSSLEMMAAATGDTTAISEAEGENGRTSLQAPISSALTKTKTTTTTQQPESISLSSSPLFIVGRNGVDLEHRKGRPDLAGILGDVAFEADHPGVFLCGPKGLVQSARRAMMLSDRNAGFAVYEETFEI